MAIYLELPVYKTCYELYLAFVQMRRKLPREERYTIGQELDRAMVDTLVLLQRINATREKAPLIVRARQLVAEVQIRLRILRDIKALSIRQFTTLFDLGESVSKQLASWQRFAQRQRVSDASAPSVPGGRPESVGSRSGGVRHTANPMNDDDPTCSTEVTS